jgi:cyclase
MNRALIVARIAPDGHGEVGRIFGASDATSLPRELGVLERSLYVLGDVYVHAVTFDRDVEAAMATAREHPGFAEISDRLRPYVSPYNPLTWRSPRDAMARRFYHWEIDAGRQDG